MKRATILLPLIALLAMDQGAQANKGKKDKPEQAVIAHLKLSGAGFGAMGDVKACQELEDRLEQEIVRARTGEMDGNEIGGGECTLFMYGPDADKLFLSIERSLRASKMAKGGWVLKRYGDVNDPKAREVKVKL
jgi:hypothetical protein